MKSSTQKKLKPKEKAQLKKLTVGTVFKGIKYKTVTLKRKRVTPYTPTKKEMSYRSKLLKSILLSRQERARIIKNYKKADKKIFMSKGTIVDTSMIKPGAIINLPTMPKGHRFTFKGKPTKDTKPLKFIATDPASGKDGQVTVIVTPKTNGTVKIERVGMHNKFNVTKFGIKPPKKITEDTLHKIKVTDRKRQIELAKLDAENEEICNKKKAEMVNSAMRKHFTDINEFHSLKITADEAPFADQTLTWSDVKQGIKSFWQDIKNVLNEFKP